MLLLPLRSPQRPRVSFDPNDPGAARPNSTSSKVAQSLDTTSTTSVHEHERDSIMITMSTTTPPLKKRPKLSLQTTKISSFPAGQNAGKALNLTFLMPSPTHDNTYTNASDCPPTAIPSGPSEENVSPQSSPEGSSSPSSSTSSATTLTSCQTSPFPLEIPYCLPLGPRSILRNSPLPRRLISATPTRTPKVLFRHAKHVCFRERLEEPIPTPILDETPDTPERSDSDSSENRLQDEIAERKALDDLLEEEAAMPLAHGRRKRRREWIWRPLDDDILYPSQGKARAAREAKESSPVDHSIPEPKREQSVIENLQSHGEMPTI